MIYETDYMKLKIHNDTIEWNNGISIIPISSITGMIIKTNKPCIVIYTKQGTHYLYPIYLPTPVGSRAYKNCVKELGNMFGWIYWVTTNKKRLK
jgi:hypothetical protein